MIMENALLLKSIIENAIDGIIHIDDAGGLKALILLHANYLLSA